MKTISQRQWRSKLCRAQNGLGVSRKELAQILGVAPNQLRHWMRATRGRVEVDGVFLSRCKELEKLVQLGNIALDSSRGLKRWLRSGDIPVYGDSCPLDYLKQCDYEMVMHSLAVIAGHSCV